MKQRINAKKPSPTYQTNPGDSARNPQKIPNGNRVFGSKKAGFIKGISLFASRIRGKRKGRRKTAARSELCAGMTVEAAIVLPLFLFFFLNLGCAIEMIRLHGNLQLALWQIGRELSVYGYAVDSGELPEEQQKEDSWWKELGGIAFGTVFVKNKLIQLTGEEYLEHSPLTRGSDSLLLGESRIFEEGDIMDIVVTYSVSPWSKLAGFPSFRMANRYYTHIWNGYELSGESTKKEEEQTVYITASATVYHLYRDCTHLQLSVQVIGKEEVTELRNQNGGRYRPCEKCADNTMGNVLYVTRDGDCYHFDRQCSGLKRTIYSVKRSDVADLGLCGRCGQRSR